MQPSIGLMAYYVLKHTAPSVCCRPMMRTRTIVIVLVATGLAVPGWATCAGTGARVASTPDATCCFGPQGAGHQCCCAAQVASVDPVCGCLPIERTDQGLSPARVDDPERRPLTVSSMSGSTAADPVVEAGVPGRTRVDPNRDTGPPPLLISCVLRL